ncbi:MAG: hypothetical protein COW63_03755, partial [Bacteroidetes bacterium CG18_big_fil_WC_8_21_14_2_50_41_14]
VTDDNGCGPTVSSPLTIIDPEQIAINIDGFTDMTCHGYADGTIQASATGGTGTRTFSITPGTQTNTTGLFTGLPADDYTIRVTDVNGCWVESLPVTITDPPGFTITTETFTQITCNNADDGSITVTATGGTGSLNYTLQPIGTTSTTGFFDNLVAGTYSVLVEDVNLCSQISIDFILVNPEAILIQSESYTDISCRDNNDGLIDIIATGGTGDLTFSLYLNGTLFLTQPNGSFSNLSEGDYYVTVDDINGCPTATSASYTITNPPALVIDSEASTNSLCYGCNNGTITVQASGGTPIILYTLNPGGNSNTTGSFVGLAPNTYTVTVTDDHLCELLSSEFIITEPPLFMFIDQLSTDLTCHDFNDGTVTVTVSGGLPPYSFMLNQTGTIQGAGYFIDLVPNTYTVTVTDANSNSITSAELVVGNPEVLTITTINWTTPTCNGCTNGTAQAIVTGGTAPYTHHWSNDMTGNPIIGLGAGFYTDTVSDVNGCTTYLEVQMTEPEVLVLLTDSLDVKCFGFNTGWAAAIVTGGTQPYSYEWRKIPNSNIIGTTDTIFNLFAGVYEVTLYDFYDNVLTAEVTISEPEAFLLSFNFSDTVCYQESNGWTKVTATGGVMPYLYSWGNPEFSTQDSIYGLPAGNYTLTATDNNLCETIGSIEIIENQEITVTAGSSSNLICSGESVQLTSTATGGTLPIVSYFWTPSNSLNNPNIQNPTGSPTATTNYTVTATDSRGCQEQSTVTVNVNATPTASYTYYNPCESNVVSFTDQSQSNGETIISWFWDFGDGYTSTDRNPTHYYGQTPADYTISLTVQNSNGCDNSYTNTIHVEPVLGIDFSADNICLNEQAHFFGTVTSSSNITSWVWDFGDGTSGSGRNPLHIYNSPSAYNVTLIVTDVAG